MSTTASSALNDVLGCRFDDMDFALEDYRADKITMELLEEALSTCLRSKCPTTKCVRCSPWFELTASGETSTDVVNIKKEDTKQEPIDAVPEAPAQSSSKRKRTTQEIESCEYGRCGGTSNCVICSEVDKAKSPRTNDFYRSRRSGDCEAARCGSVNRCTRCQKVNCEKEAVWYEKRKQEQRERRRKMATAGSGSIKEKPELGSRTECRGSALGWREYCGSYDCLKCGLVDSDIGPAKRNEMLWEDRHRMLTCSRDNFDPLSMSDAEFELMSLERKNEYIGKLEERSEYRKARVDFLRYLLHFFKEEEGRAAKIHRQRTDSGATKGLETRPDPAEERKTSKKDDVQDPFAFDVFDRYYLTYSEERFLQEPRNRREERMVMIIGRLGRDLHSRDFWKKNFWDRHAVDR